MNDMIPRIVQYAETITSDDYQPTIECLVTVLGIIGDLCGSYKDKMKSLINQTKIKNIMSRIIKTDPETYADIIEWANSVIYF
jgi:hypothetical protein